MIIIMDKDDNVVSRSKNLRGILRFAGKQGVQEIVVTSIMAPKGGAVLEVFFYGGYYARADFASFQVCERWIRRPLFNNAAVHIA